MGDSVASAAAGKTGTLLAILAPVPLPAMLSRSVYPLHGPVHLK